MSLRFRLNLLITCVFLVLLAAGVVLVIQNARNAVSEEMQSTANLALNLLDVSVAGTASDSDTRSALVERLRELEKTRHLRIQMRATGDETRISPSTSMPTRIARAPQWFADLVEPAPLLLEHRIGDDDAYSEILISADPADEIGEAWEEARTTLALLLALSVLANVLVYITVGRALKPVDRIIAGLESIEQGDYASRLDPAGTPELAGIARKVNRIADTLEAAREQTRFLTQKSLAIQEDERRRLAQELHDELGQSLSGINAIAGSITQGTQDESLAKRASSISEVVKHMHTVIREMMRRLRPAGLDELGLVSAIEQLVDDWNEYHADAVCRMSPVAETGTLDPQIEITVYRVIQEALTNVASHAQANRVDISLEIDHDGKALMLSITDDGAGMDTDLSHPGLGLLGMRERVESLHGNFELRSRPGKGVTLRVRVPIKPIAADGSA